MLLMGPGRSHYILVMFLPLEGLWPSKDHSLGALTIKQPPMLRPGVGVGVGGALKARSHLDLSLVWQSIKDFSWFSSTCKALNLSNTSSKIILSWTGSQWSEVRPDVVEVTCTWGDGQLWPSCRWLASASVRGITIIKLIVMEPKQRWPLQSLFEADNLWPFPEAENTLKKAFFNGWTDPRVEFQGAAEGHAEVFDRRTNIWSENLSGLSSYRPDLRHSFPPILFFIFYTLI